MHYFLMLSMLVSSLFVSVYAQASNRAAENYLTYCALCHGNLGMGEGMLPAVVEGYPNTNLIKQSQLNSLSAITDGILYGHTDKSLSLHKFMPPWQDELSAGDVKQLAQLILDLREQPDKALNDIRDASQGVMVRASVGRKFFQTRCSLCHGKSARGDGRMAAILKDAPPANLITSKLNKADMLNIISNGGAAVGRSPSMPPWKDQLSEHDILSILSYIDTLK